MVIKIKENKKAWEGKENEEKGKEEKRQRN